VGRRAQHRQPGTSRRQHQLTARHRNATTGRAESALPVMTFGVPAALSVDRAAPRGCPAPGVRAGTG
jgi:hypothetical protein